MPQRKAPPSGYCTATEAMKILGNKMLYRYIERGLIHPLGPEIRKHKYYSISELEQVRAQETAFYNPPKTIEQALQNHTISFSRATPDDMEGVYAVASKLFHHTTSADARKPLVDRCPDGNYILKDNGIIVAYIHLQPLKHDRLMEFMHGRLRGWELSVDDLQCFPIGTSIELLIKSVGAYAEKPAMQRFYMQRLLVGTAHAIAQLGSKGVYITKLYATSETPTGIEMAIRAKMTSMGPMKGSKGMKRYAFVLDVATSDLQLVHPYQVAYAMWQSERTAPVRAAVTSLKKPPPTATIKSNRDSLPADMTNFTHFYRRHMIADATAGRARINGKITATAGKWRDETGHPIQWALDQAQQSDFCKYFKLYSPDAKLVECGNPDCVC